MQCKLNMGEITGVVKVRKCSLQHHMKVVRLGGVSLQEVR